LFKYLIIDSNNLGYFIINRDIVRDLSKINNKIIYKTFVKTFFETIDYLKNKYESSEVILLFDNHTSKDELRKAFTTPEGYSRKDIKNTYKGTRKKESKEFYTSLDFIKYYYMVNKPTYHTVQVFKIEADDMVSPCLQAIVKDDTALMVTNDSDWTRYLSDKIQYLPEIYENPRGVDYFFQRYKFVPTEDKVVLYKVLFGDKADDISVVFPEFDTTIKNKILEDFDSIFDFILGASKKDYLKKYVSIIKDRESELKVNYQLISAIPVTQEQFLSHYTTGRDSITLITAVNNILYGKDLGDNAFVFGGLKLPRVSP